MCAQVSAPSSTPLIRYLRFMIGGAGLIFLICLALTFHASFSSPKSSPYDDSQLTPLKTSFSGDVITLSPHSPEATHEAPWDDFGDAIPRLASQALLPLLSPNGRHFLMAPRPGTTAPFAFETCDPFIPQPCEGVWIECPSVFDEREAKLFQLEMLQGWANAITSDGWFICDLDARGRAPTTIQCYLQNVATVFADVYLWSTGFQRWQIIASPSKKNIDFIALENRFNQADLFPIFQAIAIETPWPLFASLISNNINELLAVTPSTKMGAIGLIETFLPCYQCSSPIFTHVEPHVLTIRKNRYEFYQMGNTITLSADPLILGIASMDYALICQYLEQHNFTEALHLCKQIQQLAIPSVDDCILTLRLAQRLNDTEMIERMLITLLKISPSHVYYERTFDTIFQTLQALRRFDQLIHYLQSSNLHVLSRDKQERYYCELLFLRAEHQPSHEHLKELHNFLRFYPLGTSQIQMISRYGELLKFYGDARTPLRFIAAFSETKEWPPFEALKLIHKDN